MFGSFLPSLRSLSNHSLLGSRSRHCYAIKARVLIPNSPGGASVRLAAGLTESDLLLLTVIIEFPYAYDSLLNSRPLLCSMNIGPPRGNNKHRMELCDLSKARQISCSD